MLESLSILLFCALVVLAVLAFAYPWQIRGPLSQILLHAPLLAIPCFVAYEAVTPVESDRLADLPILALLTVFSFLCYCVKIFALHTPVELAPVRQRALSPVARDYRSPRPVADAPVPAVLAVATHAPRH